MDQNIRLIEPNMAMFIKDHEQKFYNLIYNREDLIALRQPRYGYENFLVQRYTDATIPLTAYPTTVELQQRVNSLDYDGDYFWSVQPLNNTPYFPGTVIRKWWIDPKQYGLACVESKSFPGEGTASAISAEYYNFPILEDMGTDRNYIIIDGTYNWIVDRLLVGQQLKLGPNIHGEYFLGTISQITQSPEWPDPDPDYYRIEFSTYPPTSHSDGENVFITTRLLVFKTNGDLWEINPKNYAIVRGLQRDAFKTVSASAFSVIKNVPNINVGGRTPAVFFVSGYSIQCLRVSDWDITVAAQSIPLNYYDAGNSFIPVHEVRVRNDDPEDINNHPFFYFLQNTYRDPTTLSVSTWPTYNYTTLKLEAQAAFLTMTISPEVVSPSGLVQCSCQALDDYRFPMSGIPINWMVTPSSSGRFITATGTITNVSGYSYATFSGGSTISFPTYISVTTTAF
jgi:hypothetical protein